ncbi:MAG: radical SAM protein [Clostridioides sp.]|jgi:uncharacterized protein|nr:radical SAM protein [Clostridioides sp.]
MENKIDINKMQKCKKFIQKINCGNELYRLGKTFKTKNTYYYYDLGTGKVLSCSKDAYKILKSFEKEDENITNFDLKDESVLNGIEEIISAYETENILKANKIESFYKTDISEIEDAINNKIEMVTLELTEKCNLRCTYCIYQKENENFRSYGHKEMNFETAKKAIDFVYNHSKDIKEKPYTITFYGGEPLLRYDLIKKCINYAEENIVDKNLYYAITTNATLITEEMANYFAKKRVAITVSIDGSKKIHDKHRVYSDGKGTFEDTLKGLKKLVTAYSEYAKDDIFINTVVSPPYNKERLDEIQEFFDDLKWLPKECIITYSYVDKGYILNEEIELLKEMICNENHNELSPIDSWSLSRQNDKYIEENSKLKLFTNAENEKELIRIQQRRIFDKPMKIYPFNSCCIPGVNRLYITTDGNFLPCEKVGEGPVIGNIEDGFNLKILKEYYFDDYINKSIKECNKCWSAQLCGVCYCHSMTKNGMDQKLKQHTCNSRRYLNERALTYYYQQLEDNPKSLEYLKDMI